MAKFGEKWPKNDKIGQKMLFLNKVHAKFWYSETVSQIFCQFYIGNDNYFSLFVWHTKNELLKHFSTKIINISLFEKYCDVEIELANFNFQHQYLLQSLQYRYHSKDKAPIYHVIIIIVPKNY